MKDGYKIIDMRCRPPYKGFLNEGYPFALFNKNVALSFCKMSGCDHVSKTLDTLSMDDFIAEMDEAGVDLAVAPYRAAWGDPVNNRPKTNNDDLLDLLKEYPNRFIGVAGMSPVYDTIDEIKAQMDKYCVNGPLKGIALEPLIDRPGWMIDDERAFAIYELAEQKNIPILLTLGGFPLKQVEALEHAAQTFPNVKFCLCHGGSPRIIEIADLAYGLGNIYISPDAIMVHGPACSIYIEAANYSLRDRICFGSNMPGNAMDYAVDYYLHCGLREEVIADVMYNNAARLFGMIEDADDNSGRIMKAKLDEREKALNSDQ